MDVSKYAICEIVKIYYCTNTANMHDILNRLGYS